MSVQIQFHIIEKFITFSSGVTSVPTLLTRLYILYMVIYLGFTRDFRKVMALFSSIYIYSKIAKTKSYEE
jgi:hypothetical protein